MRQIFAEKHILQAPASQAISSTQTAVPLLRALGHALARGGPSTLDPILSAHPDGAREGFLSPQAPDSGP